MPATRQTPPSVAATLAVASEATAPDRDAAEFLGLLDRHGAAAMGLLRRLCGNPHDADDLFQETAIRAWRGLGSRPWLRSPRPWLMTIAYRAFLDSRKAARKQGDAVEVADDRQAEPAAVAERLEQQTQVQAAVAELPETLRTVVVLHYSGGLSLRQVAAAMELNVGTVKSRLNSALAQMRARLRPLNETVSEL